MKRTWTIIGVNDVATSFRWYQSLFGQPESAPAHADFGQLRDPDGTVLLCLHQWGAHEHPTLMRRDDTTPGHGLLLFFRVDDFDAALKRARALGRILRHGERPLPPRARGYGAMNGLTNSIVAGPPRGISSTWWTSFRMAGMMPGQAFSASSVIVFVATILAVFASRKVTSYVAP